MLGKDSLTNFVSCVNIHFVSLNLDSNTWLYETCKVFYCTGLFVFLLQHSLILGPEATKDY